MSTSPERPGTLGAEMRQRVAFWLLVLKGGWDFMGRIADPWGRIVFSLAIVGALFGANLPVSMLSSAVTHALLWALFGILVGGYVLEGAWQAHMASSVSEQGRGAPDAVFAATAQALAAIPAGHSAEIEASHRSVSGEETSLRITTQPVLRAAAALEHLPSVEIPSEDDPLRDPA